MRCLFVILLFFACNIMSLAQEHKTQAEESFHIDFSLKQPQLNPYSDCSLIKSQLFQTKNKTLGTFMKEEKLPYQQHIKIKYKPEIYEPTLLDAIGSQIYYIMEDKLYNNWK